MGWLYGSEYSTYLLPKRFCRERAIELTENCLPLSANRAKQLGLIDEVLSRDPETFRQEALEFAKGKRNLLLYVLAKKRLRLQKDQEQKPLAAYRQHELTQMYKNFYIPNSAYHLARQSFVRKQPACCSPLSARMLELVGLDLLTELASHSERLYLESV